MLPFSYLCFALAFALAPRVLGARGAPVTHAEIRVGDHVNWARTARRAQIDGVVLRVGPVNVLVETRFTASPTGPEFRQEHRLPKHEATHVIRDGVTHQVTPS